MLDIRDEYNNSQGNRKLTQMINAAIREECHGGHEALEALIVWQDICSRPENRWDGRGEEPLCYLAMRNLLEIVDEMEAAIREKYGLNPAPAREDYERGGHRRSKRRVR